MVFKGQESTQGQTPKCVPYAIVAARAQVDPVYALELTTGGRPGTELDSGAAFQQRLIAEANRVIPMVVRSL